MFVAKLLLILGSITVLSLRGEAAGAVCGQRYTYPTIQTLSGKPGKNGVPGEPGPKGRAIVYQEDQMMHFTTKGPVNSQWLLCQWLVSD